MVKDAVESVYKLLQVLRNVLCNFITLANVMEIQLLLKIVWISITCNPCSQKLCDVESLYDFRLCKMPV